MDYLSCCYRQQWDAPASLLLQQYRQGQVNFLFACVCRDVEGQAGAYMVRQLYQWFRGLDWKRLAGGGGKELVCLEEGLKEVVRRSDLEEGLKETAGRSDLEEGLKETAGRSDLEERCLADIAGVFCLENQYLLFHRGQARIYLLNTAFGRGHARQVRLMHGAGESREAPGWRREVEAAGRHEVKPKVGCEGEWLKEWRWEEKVAEPHGRERKIDCEGRKAEGRKTERRQSRKRWMKYWQRMRWLLRGTEESKAARKSEPCLELGIERGILEQDIGLLFATEPFFAGITEKGLAEGLFVGETATEEQMERHLKELAKEGERRGGKGIGAVYIRTVV